jgi:hypothetical protein
MMVGSWWAAACAVGLLGCGEALPYPPELQGSHLVDGRGYCEYAIAGRSEVLRPYSPRLRVIPLGDWDLGCADFLLGAPNPSPEACGRVVSSGPRWTAEITPAATEFSPSFYDSESGVGVWSLTEGVTFTGTLTYDAVLRELTFEVSGSGVAGSTSTYSGPGTVYCVFEATVAPE